VVNGVLLGLVVAVLLAVTVTAAVIVRRVLPARTTDGPRTTTRVLPEPGDWPRYLARWTRRYACSRTILSSSPSSSVADSGRSINPKAG
jgi:hypothetical protein